MVRLKGLKDNYDYYNEFCRAQPFLVVLRTETTVGKICEGYLI